MSNSAVIQLQRKIIDSNSSLTNLLRETKLLAAKLNLEDVEKWVDLELKGYPEGTQPPAYREYSLDHLDVRNPVRGWQFAGHLNIKLMARDPISEIENMSKGEWLTSPVNKNFPVYDQLGGRMGSDFPQRVVFYGAQFQRILEAVKNELIQWTIELEKRGVLGENMSFNEDEKKAASGQTFHITNSTGVFGSNVSQSTVSIHDFSTLYATLKDAGVPQGERNELENIFDELKKVEPAQKTPIFERGKEWIERNKGLLGNAVQLVTRVLMEAAK